MPFYYNDNDDADGLTSDDETEINNEPWCVRNDNYLFEVYTNLIDYLNTNGIPLMKKLNYSDFVEFCDTFTTKTEEEED